MRKKKFQEVRQAIINAINICGDDRMLMSVKLLLSNSLIEFDKSSKSLTAKMKSAELARNAEKTQYQKWWDMIKKNVSQNAINIEEKPKDV